MQAGNRHDPRQLRPPPHTGAVALEGFALAAEPNADVQTIANWLAQNAFPSGSECDYWRQTLPQRLVILPENAFRDFTQFSTEVISRIRLDDEKKTVARGALWSEESLPAYTLLYATLFASKPRVKEADLPDDWKQSSDKVGEVVGFVKAYVDDRCIQLGGDSSVGRGFVKVRMSAGEEAMSMARFRVYSELAALGVYIASLLKQGERLPDR